MRQLVLLRGAMGAGKSTWIKENGLSQYTLCADDIRLLYQSPILTVDGGETITMDNDNAVWKTLRSLLRERMKRGEFTIIDATHSKTKDINSYREIAREFRYRVTVVDFTDVPILLAKVRNKERPLYKQVPEEAIENVYTRFETQKVPNWVNIIKPHEFSDKMRYIPVDYSNYNTIHHIGDIHGCNTVLQEYLQDGLKEDELYIFLGDFIDRGVENAEVLKFMFDIMDSKNVIFLEGNHEQWLWRWANGQDTPSKEFNKYTKPQLEEAGVDKKRSRMFYRKLQQMVYYKYNTVNCEVRVLVTHGGLSHMPDNFLTVATTQLINGVGDYSTDVDQFFTDNMIKANTTEIRGGRGNRVITKWQKESMLFQIHGHRNLFGHDTLATKYSFNLEGGIERGGELRAVTLDQNGFTAYEVNNPVFSERMIPKKVDKDTTVEEMLSNMRENRYIKEKKLKDNISSFNFSPQAFYKGVWDSQTMKARGLFINTNTNEIVARSYDKFFNVNERKETDIASLKNNLSFPIRVTEKPNGYLGIVGYNSEKEEVVYASKSSTKSDHAKWLKEIIEDRFTASQRELLENTVKNNLTLVFEVIDPINDPHIIKYDKRDIILLDIIYNTPVFKKESRLHVMHLAHGLGIKHVKLERQYSNFKSFYEWYKGIMSDDSIMLEGFVIEDDDGFMTKMKLPYYKFWKNMRGVKEAVQNGRPVRTGSLNTTLANRFYGFLLKKDSEELKTKSIIELRDEYYQILK